jgi:hypothetical protein
MMRADPPAETHRFSRRGMLRLAALGLWSVLFAGHTPYGQWTVYRQRNLFVVASRTDPEAVALAYALADGLAAQLPTSRARMTRATDPVRVASLLATGQLDVAIVARADAAGMLAGAGDFRAVGTVPLRRLADLGAHLLVALESFRNKHAYLLADAVEHLRPNLPISAGAAADLPAVPEHVGALAYRTGLPLPIERGEADAAGVTGVLPGSYQP